MNCIIEAIEQRRENFTITVPRPSDYVNWIIENMLANPAVFATLYTFSYSYSSSSSQTTYSFLFKYEECEYQTFLVRNEFEFLTACTIARRLGIEKFKIIIDNRSNFISYDDVFDKFDYNNSIMGTDFKGGQRSFERDSNRHKIAFFGGAVICLSGDYQYFDKQSDVNKLSCMLACQAAYMCRDTDDPWVIINKILFWFRDHIKYLDRNLEEDHSAVGLFKNSTGVCQSIAAYADLLLNHCGIDARYVSGKGDGNGGWGSHAWNTVKVNGRWHHIDYTFELKSSSQSVLRPIEEFRKDHKWDESKYGAAACDKAMQNKHNFDKSLITVPINGSCFGVNGCIIDLSRSHKVCINNQDEILISYKDILPIYDISCEESENNMYFYYYKKTYCIRTNLVKKIGGIDYLPVGSLSNLGFHVAKKNNIFVIMR